jgi:hypothetical protein
VQHIVQKVKLNKCLKLNKILNQFLKAIRELLTKALQALITTVIKVNYYLKRFRAAYTIVLQKLSKLDYANLRA